MHRPGYEGHGRGLDRNLARSVPPRSIAAFHDAPLRP